MCVCKIVFVHCWTYHGHSDQRPLPDIAGDGNASVHITSVLRLHTVAVRGLRVPTQKRTYGHIRPVCAQTIRGWYYYYYGRRPSATGCVFNVPERMHASVLYPPDMGLLRVGTSSTQYIVASNNTPTSILTMAAGCRNVMDSSRQVSRHSVLVRRIDFGL